MTHPITPPPELVKQWITEWCNTADGLTYSKFLITRAAQWGWDQREPEIQAVADQEFEACLEWAKRYDTEHWSYSESLRAARRPKPPSLKEQALADFDWLVGRTLGRPEFDERSERIRRALKALPDDFPTPPTSAIIR